MQRRYVKTWREQKGPIQNRQKVASGEFDFGAICEARDISAIKFEIYLTTDANHRAYAGTFSGTNGKIAFASNRDGHLEIYVMNVDDTGQTNLSSKFANDANPDWGIQQQQTRPPTNKDTTPPSVSMTYPSNGYRHACVFMLSCIAFSDSDLIFDISNKHQSHYLVQKWEHPAFMIIDY